MSWQLACPYNKTNVKKQKHKGIGTDRASAVLTRCVGYKRTREKDGLVPIKCHIMVPLIEHVSGHRRTQALMQILTGGLPVFPPKTKMPSSQKRRRKKISRLSVAIY